MSSTAVFASQPMAAELSAPVRRDPDPPSPMKGSPPWQDWLFERTTMAFALFVLLVLLGIIAALTWAAIPAFSRFGFGFLFTNVWNPVTKDFGALAPIYGTLVT